MYRVLVFGCDLLIHFGPFETRLAVLQRLVEGGWKQRGDSAWDLPNSGGLAALVVPSEPGNVYSPGMLPSDDFDSLPVDESNGWQQAEGTVCPDGHTAYRHPTNPYVQGCKECNLIVFSLTSFFKEAKQVF